MALRLNATPEAYKEFYGANVKQMPKLVAEGRVPMSVAGLMQRRLDVRNSDADVKTAYMDNYFDTGDAVVYHSDGRVKIVLDSAILQGMTPNSPRNGGALVLSEDIYRTLIGEEFKKGKLGQVNTGLSVADVKSHPVWKALARGDKALLNDYADFIFTEYQTRFAKDTKAEDLQLMGVYPDSAGETPKLRAWCVDGLGDGSGADGGNVLGFDGGRLVGVAPEAQSAKNSGASAIQKYTMADIQTARKQLDTLAQVVRPENLEDVKSLIAKL